MTTATLQPPDTAHHSGRAAPPRPTPPRDPYKWTALGVVLLFALTLPSIIATVAALQPEPTVEPWAEEAAALGVRPYDIARGAAVYQNSCALCHGKQGEGVKRLGKPLRNSAYVQTTSDDEIFRLLARGRSISDPLNTTGVLMPPRGAQNLTDSQLNAVTVYLRALQDPSQPHADTDAWVIRKPGAAGSAAPAGETGADAAEAATPGAGTEGMDLFVASCSACHGERGEGVEDLGKPLDNSPFVDSKTDDELITFIKTGRPIWDPENTTGLDMPSKGGNPALTNDQLADIVTFIRGLSQ